MPIKTLTDKFHFKSDSIFQGLPKEDLTFLESTMIERIYKKGQRIFVEGTMPSGIYYLKKGKIKKYKADHHGKEQIIYICSSGDLFGHPALFSEGAYSDTSAALEDSVVAFIPKGDFLQVLAQSPVLSNRILKNLSHEFGVLLNTIAAFAHRTVRERTALTLLILKEKYKVKGESNKPVEINLSRADLSNMVGTATETLVRLLRDSSC